MPTKNSILSLADAKALVHVEGRDVFATSRELAEHFKKRHDRILRKIENLSDETFSHLQIGAAEYLDAQGKQRKEYRLNRDAFSFVAMSLTGADADEWKLKYIAAFNLMEAHLRKQFAEPPRKDILQDKRSKHHPMMAVLVEGRAAIGKKTAENNFTNENRLCNYIVTGKFEKIEEGALSNEDAKFLADVRDRNRGYLMADLPYKERKDRLSMYFATRRMYLLN